MLPSRNPRPLPNPPTPLTGADKAALPHSSAWFCDANSRLIPADETIRYILSAELTQCLQYLSCVFIDFSGFLVFVE